MRPTGEIVKVEFKIPRGRSAAERRLAAVAALHAPKVKDHGAVRGIDLGYEIVCPECSNRYDRVAWPCATARLLGAWPGEEPES